MAKAHSKMDAQQWLKDLGLEQLSYDLPRLIYVQTNLRAELARPLATEVILLFKKHFEERLTITKSSEAET